MISISITIISIIITFVPCLVLLLEGQSVLLLADHQELPLLFQLPDGWNGRAAPAQGPQGLVLRTGGWCDWGEANRGPSHS